MCAISPFLNFPYKVAVQKHFNVKGAMFYLIIVTYFVSCVLGLISTFLPPRVTISLFCVNSQAESRRVSLYAISSISTYLIL